MADTRKIAKNTLYMYARMLLVMAVTIYTSRVILDKLGVDDYGLFNAIASVVAIISFLNDTLSTSTSRFLTYDLGRGDSDKLRNTFSTAFFTHFFLAILIIFIMESAGLWYMNYKFVIPEGREASTFFVFHLSIITTAISVIIVPYTALITAHEDMNIYAYVGILDVTLRLIAVYFLVLSPTDKLIAYACLLLVVQMIVALIYLSICLKRYDEAKLKVDFDRKVFGNMLGFTGWTAIANISNTLMVQGAILLLNLFFFPAVIAAKALADQVSSAIMRFVNNFRLALNPQIIKSYAANDYESSKRLTLKSTIISFDLMLIIGLPFIFTMDTVLNVWLKEVPAQAVIFAQVAVFSQIINTISSSTYIAFVSSGKLTSNAIYGLVSGLLFFVTLYVIYRFGGEAVWVQYLYLIFGLIGIIIIRPWLLNRDVNYSVKDVFSCYWNCFIVFLPSLSFSYVLYRLLGKDLFSQGVLFVGVATICVLCSYLFMDRSMKDFILGFIKSKVRQHKS